MHSWSRIQAELAYARVAREHGKEGRARVCARRAAGWAISAHYPELPPRSAITLLRWLESNGPDELRAAAARLVVGVNQDHQLPHAEDPLDDAELIVNALVGSETAARR